MKKSDLKKMIKPLIRECLAEIFMEMNLETIVENVVNRTRARSPEVRRTYEPEVIVEQAHVAPAPPPPQPQESPEERRARMMRKLGVSEAEWASMYAGTEPLSEDVGGPEIVSEEVLRESGLFRDYSKFVDK